MIAVGLTGSIAMGKSTVAAMFTSLGTPVFDADTAVRVYYDGPGAAAVQQVFPGILSSGCVDRERLSRLVLSDPMALVALEGLVHPVVSNARALFVERAVAEHKQMSVIDVPLLFETGEETSADVVIVASAPAPIQRSRSLGREGMTEGKLAAILSRQTSDEEKRRKAHFVIDTGGSMEQTRAQVKHFARAVMGLRG
jgi:dephospho-CoA kinase